MPRLQRFLFPSATAWFGSIIAGLALMIGASPVARAEPAHAKELTTEQANAFLDAALPAQLDTFGLPGAAVVIVADGKVLTTRGFGVADVESGRPVNPETTGMFTASVAKTFTATAVQQLVEQHKVDLDRDVNDYLQGRPIADTYPGQPVTLRHLLTHTAGFDYRVPLGAGERDDDHGRTLREQLETEQPRRVRPPGGGQVSYDNFGPSLAGLVVEEVTGQPFEQYVDEHIFNPLGMNDSTMTQPHSGPVRTARAQGYRVSDSGQVRTYGQFGPSTPAGAGVVSTASDMGKFMLAQLPQPERPILTPSSVRAMQRSQASIDPILPGMGLMWELHERDGRPLVSKDGDIPGFHTNLVLLPQQSVGIYVAYNGDGIDNSAWYAGKELQRQFLDRFYPQDSRATDVERVDASAAAYAGTYLARHTSRSELIGASGLVGGITVDAAANGSLATTDPMAEDPGHAHRQWIPVGNRHFREVGGDDQLVFSADGESMATSSMPTYSYVKVPGYRSPVLHQAILYGGMAPLILAMVGWSVVGLVRRRRRATLPTTGGARAARILAWISGVAMITYVVSFLRLMGDGATLNETLFLGDSSLLITVRALSSLALTGAAAMIICAALSWRRGWWGVGGRLAYTFSALGLAASLTICIAHSMVGPGLW